MTLPLRFLIAASSLVCPLLVSAQTPQLSVDEAAVRFNFPATHFLAEIPVHNAGSATSAQVTVDLIDPQDTIRSHGSATCSLRSAVTVCSVTLPPASPAMVANSSNNGEDLAALRVRYNLVAASQPTVTGTLALDHIAPALFVLHMAAPSQIRPGGFYTVRIRATHPLTNAPQPNVPLDATITAPIDSKPHDLIASRKHLVTDRNGFATLEFTAPTSPDLALVKVVIEGRLTNLYSGIAQDLDVPSQQSLSLTTDKPLYQPGQSVHLRLLALDRTGHAKAGSKLKFDVSDPDNTLVFRTEATTSHFGIASADWMIPARLRLGHYSIAVKNEDDEDNSSARAQINISRYDLPTFTVAPKPDKPFYLPGQNAAVEVRASYLFGKPVLHGHVRVVRETEREWNYEKQKYDTKEGAAYTGELGADGSFTAHVDLSADGKKYSEDPDSATSNDFTDLHLAAYVTDASTGRTEQRRFDLRVSAQSLHVFYIKDRGAAIGLPVSGYVSVTTADGQPAVNADIRIELLPRSSAEHKETLSDFIAHSVPVAEFKTDSYGLVRLDHLPTYETLVKRTPPPIHPSSDDRDTFEPDLLITAIAPDARSGRAIATIEEPDSIFRFTTDRTLYKPGDPIIVTLASAKPSLPVHLQLLRTTSSGLVTLAAENIILRNGRATSTISSGTTGAPDPRFTGYLTVSAVAFGSDDTETSTASHTVLFPRDNSLHVDVKVAHDTYRPGDTATATVDIKGPQDPDGEDTSVARSALGLVAVDQAVTERNRSDDDFGGSSFFFPWRSIFNSSNQVAGLSLADIEQRDPDKPFTPDLDLAAAVLLDDSRSHLELTDNTPLQNSASIFSQVLNKQLDPIRKALRGYLSTHPDAPTTIPGLDDLLAAQKLSIFALRDPWGKPYHLTVSPNYTNLQLELVSDGPDKQPNTDDDFSINLTAWNWFARYESDLRRVLIDEHQRTGGFIRDLRTLTAAMQAEHIDFTAWRDPWGQPFIWTFSINQADYTVTASSDGPPPDKDRTSRNQFTAGSASISWFTDDRLRGQQALNAYVANHPFPTTEEGLRAARISPGKLIDPWGHGLYATFRTRSIFTDRVTVEARAHAGEAPQKHTIVTPVTAIVDTVDLWSTGPDGKRGKADKDGSNDDFIAASFSHERSQQSAKEAAPQSTDGDPAHSGETGITTGAISGTITDATGAAISNASILATNAATQAEFEGKSESDGQYILAPLPAGLYTVRVTSPGFQTTVIDQVHVLSPDTTLLDVKLQVGTVSEMVEVTSGSVTINTESASLATVLYSLAYAGKPMGGRFARGLYIDGFTGGQLAPRTATPRVREYFPETLLWRPEVLTADDGTATIRFPVADNITTWQLSVAASTLRGNIGAGMTAFQTFLPFFAALDPPQVLTTGDRIALPITLRNYLDHPVKVRSELPPAPWLRIDTPPETATVPAGDSASPIAGITAIAPVLNGKLRFIARPEGDTGDAIEHPVTVHPDGLETAVSAAGIVSGPTTFDVTIPADTLAGGNDASITLYPNLSAHLRDALAAMANYPDGCAEQIISIAWPSLLLQRYAAKLPAPDKQLVQQTRLNLEAAYANLLSDRDGTGADAGGFRYWANDKQPDLALTAYAVQFLTAAQKFAAVDDDVIKAAVAYLAKQQSASGLWIRVGRDGKPHPEDTAGNAMLTASIAAMIAGAPGADPLIEKALAATQPFTESIDEPYTLANYTLAAIAVGDTARSQPAIARLRTLALSEDGGAYWNLETNTPFFGWGRAGRVETTAAVLRTLLAAGAKPNDDLVNRGLLFLYHQQDRQSMWYSTQATARTLDVLAAATLVANTPAPHAKSGSLTVRVDGNSVATVALPATGKDAGPLFIPLGGALASGTHKVTLDLPDGATSAQIVANLYRPWPTAAPASATTNNEQLRLAVSFDNKSAATGAPIHATAHIERLGFRGYGMLIAEIGLPPGADVDRASLETAVAESGYTLNHYEVLPDKLLVYLWPEAGGYDLHFTFSLRYAVDALTAPSVVYDYYNPDARLDVPPQRFTSLR
jgi:hypothetical protein